MKYTEQQNAKPRGASQNFISLECWPKGFGISVNEHEDEFIVALFYYGKRLATIYEHKTITVPHIRLDEIEEDILDSITRSLRSHGVIVTD